LWANSIVDVSNIPSHFSPEHFDISTIELAHKVKSSINFRHSVKIVTSHSRQYLRVADN